MIDLDFAVTGIEIARDSVAPLLLLNLQVSNRTPSLPVEHVMLQAQIRIEAPRRDYSAGERERLSDLFGAAGDWSRGLRGLLWTNASLPIPAFADSRTVELPLPCSTDLSVAVTKYFEGVEAGDAPLLLLFGGSVFFRDPAGDLQIAQIAHHKEAGYRLPVGLWREMMDRYYPDTMWLRISRELFEEVKRYKRRHGLATPEEALRQLLAASAADARP
jgi:hypothetical protein